MAEPSPDIFPFHLRREDFGTPSRLYARRRQECPLGTIRLPSGDLAHMVMDYNDAAFVLRDRRFSRNFRHPGAPRMVADGDMSQVADSIVNVDPPEHTRLRRTIQGAFKPSQVETWRPIVQHVVAGLLDQLASAGPPADLVATYTSLLPISVMCELLEVPPQDKKRLISWTGVFFSTSSASLQERAAANGAMFIGGQENTSATLARGIFTLLRHHEQYEALCADPELVDGAVEEILRFDLPSEGAFLRVATEDVELAAGAIGKGSAVQVSLAAANRDRSCFADPDRFDIRRAPNPHLAFGAGAHFCVGAHLARLELQTALRALATRFPGLRLATEVSQARYAQDTLVRALHALRVTW